MLRKEIIKLNKKFNHIKNVLQTLKNKDTKEWSQIRKNELKETIHDIEAYLRKEYNA